MTPRNVWTSHLEAQADARRGASPTIQRSRCAADRALCLFIRQERTRLHGSPEPLGPLARAQHVGDANEVVTFRPLAWYARGEPMRLVKSRVAEVRRLANALDVASYIVDRHGPVTGIQLQKLVYYAQAWSLAWTGNALFPDRIEAWVQGPVVPALWSEHRGQFTVDSVAAGDSLKLTLDEREIVDAVMERYANLSADELSRRTHSEAPWLSARRGVPDGAGSANVIRCDSLADYYRTTVSSVVDEERRHGGAFYLQCLLSGVSDVNRHGEVSTGPPVGYEVW